MLELERLLLSLLAPPQRLNLVLGSLNASNMFDKVFKHILEAYMLEFFLLYLDLN